MTEKLKPLAIICGGTSGLGLAVAKQLLATYDLALIYRSNHHGAEMALLNLAVSGEETVRVYCKNVIDSASADDVYAQIKNDFKRVPQVLINSAGYTKVGLFLTSEFLDFKDSFDNHVFGVFGMIRAVAADMYQHKYGRIVNISSIATFSNQKGLSAYAAAKSALESFSQSIATELFHKNITVNVVQPGIIKNTKFAGPGVVPEKEVASLISFLIGPDASTITGAKYLIDAGRGRWLS